MPRWLTRIIRRLPGGLPLHPARTVSEPLVLKRSAPFTPRVDPGRECLRQLILEMETQDLLDFRPWPLRLAERERNLDRELRRLETEFEKLRTTPRWNA